MKTAYRLIAIASLGFTLNVSSVHADEDNWDEWNATWDQWPTAHRDDRRDRWEPDRRWERRWERRWRQQQRLRRFGNHRLGNQWYYDPFPFDRRSSWGWLPHRGSSFALGTRLGYGAFHDRGDHRFCDHRRNSRDHVGRCYRIERTADGRRRRVALPASACR